MNTFTLAGSTARRLIQALCAALALTLLLVLTGCGSTASTTDGAKSNNGKKTVLTTFTVLADIARNVAGDDLNVESLTKPGAEIHEYEPTLRPEESARRRPGTRQRPQPRILVHQVRQGLQR